MTKEKQYLPAISSNHKDKTGNPSKIGLYTSIAAVVVAVSAYLITSDSKRSTLDHENFPVYGLNDSKIQDLCVGYTFQLVGEKLVDVNKAISSYMISCSLPEQGHAYKFSAMSERIVPDKNPMLRTGFAIYSDYEDGEIFARFDPHKTDAKNFYYREFIDMFQSDLNNIAPVFKDVYAIEARKGERLNEWWKAQESIKF